MSSDFILLSLEAFDGLLPIADTSDLGEGLFEVRLAGFPSPFQLSMPPRSVAGYEFLEWQLVRPIDALAYALATFSSLSSENKNHLAATYGGNLLEARRLAHAWWQTTCSV